MGALIRTHDWTRTSLGPPETWPQPLKTAARLLLSSRHPMFLWWGPDLIQLYNDAYALSLGSERHPSALGQDGRVCWADFWDIVGPQIALVMSGGGATWHENQRTMIVRNGHLDEVYWTYGYSPIDDPSAPNGVGGVLVVCTETTQAVLAEQLRLATDAAEIALWDIDLASDRLHWPARMKAMFGISPDQPITSTDFYRSLHPEDRESTITAFAAAIDPALRAPYDVEYRAVGKEDGVVRWIQAKGRAIFDGQGVGQRVIGAALDITARKDIETHLQLIANELNHRVKNSLATVQAIVVQTLRRDEVPPTVRESLTERLFALSKAHDVLTDENWAGAGLHEIARQAGAPYASGDAERFVVSGPTVILPPKSAIALALAFHELATNAAKYGALSTPEGHVRVTWVVAPDDGQGRRLRLTWRETGGPAIAAPDAVGFGTRLIERGLATELHGRAEISYPPSGAVCVLEAVLPPEPTTVGWTDEQASLPLTPAL